MSEPSPPKVHAPHRVSSEGTKTGAGSDTQAVNASAAGSSSTSQGATVTASVGGAQSPPSTGSPAGPSTSTPTTATPAAGAPGGGLARTGFDVGLVLTFALLAVLLGVLLVRLGSRRARPSTTH